MRNIFCKKLAAFLHMNQSPSHLQEHTLTKVDDGEQNNNQGSQHVKLIESVKNQLKEIRDFQHENHENGMKNDWMLAAAILDRIFAITVTFIYVVGSIVFFGVFANQP